MEIQVNDYLKTRQGFEFLMSNCREGLSVTEAVAEAEAILQMEEPEPYAIVEVPCMDGFRYVGLRTKEEYEKFQKEHPECYYT